MAGIDVKGTKLLHRAMPFAETLGIEVLAHSEELVRARLKWSEELRTSDGLMHGGVVMSLADSAGALCAFLNLPDGARTATIDSRTSFLLPIRDGYATATARPLQAGRTVIVVETEVHQEEGKLAAKVLQSQAVLFPRK